MTQIVKGLFFHYSTAQLAEAMNDRARYHDDRAASKALALPELRKAVETVKASAEAKAVAQMSKASGYSFDARHQVESLESDIRDHKNRALVFRALAQRLVPDAIYELAEADLRRLEIIK